MTLLVTWLWQGLAVACVTALALKLTRRLNAATRHVIWWLALAAVLAIPVVHLIDSFAETPSITVVAKSTHVETAMLILPPLPGLVTTALILLWIFSMVFGLIHVARSWREIGRLKRGSVSFDVAREERLMMWVSARHSSHRKAGLRISERRMGACALGLGGPPVILVSGSLVETLSDGELDEIVMHEQAHLERRDDWMKLLQAIIGSIAGLHPAMRFIMRQIDADCESACDDRVVARTGNPHRYARTLTAAALAAVEHNDCSLSPGATGATAALRRRVDRLLDERCDRGTRLAWATSLTSLVVLVIAVSGAPRLAPIVAFVEAAEAMLPAPVLPEASASLVTEPARERVSSAFDADSAAASRPVPVMRRVVRKRPIQSPASLQIESLSQLVGVERPPDAPNSQSAGLLSSRAVGSDVPALMIGRAPVASTSGRSTDATEAWSGLATSATNAAIDAAHAATETGSRFGNIGASFGGLATRMGKALANQF